MRRFKLLLLAIVGVWILSLMPIKALYAYGINYVNLSYSLKGMAC